MENESKTTAAAEQPEGTQSVEAAQAPDATTGAELERSDNPSDGEGCEAVTVIIVCRNPKQGELMARSVMKNLVGADIDIHLVSEENLRDTLQETLLEHLPHVHTERIILMTDGMLILNPVTIHDIGVKKNVTNLLPALMHKSALEGLLNDLKENMPYADVVEAYNGSVIPEVKPIVLRNWREENWLVPIGSVNPPIGEIRKWSETQKFIHVAPQSWSEELVQFFEEHFPKE